MPYRRRVMLIVCAVAMPAGAVELTASELRWLRAAAPVLGYAQAQGLPVDVVVQPQSAPGDAPLAMGSLDGRCKLVLSLRGNPAAEATLVGVPAGLEGPVMEAVVAHEVAHCWRRVQGGWKEVPAPTHDEAAAERERWRAEMAATRREEGYADLVGLAWTLQRHPAHYEAVHAWLERVRADPVVPGSHHDTREWVALARDRGVFRDGATPFEQALPAWRRAAAPGR